MAGDVPAGYLALPAVLRYQDCRLMPFGRVAAAVAPHLPLPPSPVRCFAPAEPLLRSRCRAKSRRRAVELLPGRYSARPCKLALAEPPGRPGLDVQLLVPEREDISLQERCRRVNKICQQFGVDQVLLISIHVNAAGNGKEWKNARGWCCFTTAGETTADALATCLYEAAQAQLSGHRIRKDNTDGDPDLEKDFYILRHSRCPAVLTENLFMDNQDDIVFLESAEGAQALINLHVEGIRRYLSQ